MHYTDEQAIPGTTLGVISVMQKVMQHGEVDEQKCKFDAHNRLRRDSWRLLRSVFFEFVTVVQIEIPKNCFCLSRLFAL